MSKSKKSSKAPPVLDASKYTFRTLIHELQTHTTLPGSFYRKFNRDGRLAAARAAFDTAVPEAAEQTKKQRKRTTSADGRTSEPLDSAAAVLEHINATIGSIDTASTGAAEAITQAYALVDSLDELQAMMARKQLRKILNLSVKDEQHFINAARAAQDLSAVEIDLIERVTAEYQRQHKLLYTMDEAYKYNAKRKVWRRITERAIEAEIQQIVREMATRDSQIHINRVCAESVRRLMNECNGELLFENLYNDHKVRHGVADFESLNPTTTDLFTNMENLLTASGDSHLYCRNALVRINTERQDKRIPEVNVYDACTAKKFSMADVLFNAYDQKINKNKKLYTVDTARDGLYYTHTFAASYMRNVELLKAVKNGKAKYFMHFLDCISAHLDGHEKWHFLTAYLDMLAYIIQPIKRHNCFFYLYGLGENGKTFGILIAQQIAGNHKVPFRDLENANENPRFFTSTLSDSYAVVEDDLQHFKPELAGLLKKYSNGNQVVTTELKHGNDMKTFLLKASMVLLSNKRINIADTTKGMSRRLYPFTFGTDIGDMFTRSEHGLKVLDSELSVVFNLLRYRMARVIKNGVQHNELMRNDINRITRSSTVDKLLLDIKPANGKQLKLTDVLAHIYDSLMKVYGTQSRQAERLSLELLRDKITQLGFDLDETSGIVLDAKLDNGQKKKGRKKNSAH